jgi:hypothetical protein
MTMYTIKYWAPSGRTFTHTGTHEGISDLIKRELNGVRYQSVGKPKFQLGKPEQEKKDAA